MVTTPTIQHAVRRVIGYMHLNLGQDLTIDDMARTAMFSKFHFTRVFRDATGTSPGRFLSALRIQEAKRLLVSTDFSVADISSQVGYSSVGTFSSRFKACVGLSPRGYRESGGVMTGPPAHAGRALSPARSRSVRGRVVLPHADTADQIFVGLFPSCIRQGLPVRWTVLEGSGSFELRDVPSGTWHILAHSVDLGRAGADTDGTRVLSVGDWGPVTVGTDVLLRPAEITLRPIDLMDPPVLLPLFSEGALETRQAA